MENIISVNVSGSSDCDSGTLSSLFKGKFHQVRVKFIYTNLRMFKGQYIVSVPDDISKEKKEEVYQHIRGFASHAVKLSDF